MYFKVFPLDMVEIWVHAQTPISQGADFGKRTATSAALRSRQAFEMSLHGKVAVITGAASGLGRGFAVAFAKEGTQLV